MKKNDNNINNGRSMSDLELSNLIDNSEIISSYLDADSKGSVSEQTVSESTILTESNLKYNGIIRSYVSTDSIGSASEQALLGPAEIQKMLFIYNAVNDGWTIRKIGFDKFELLKDNEHIKKEIVLGEYLKKYIKYNGSQ
jgi:hypothetical protein